MSYIPLELRRQVKARAHGCCEYCLVDEEDNYLSHEVDHIISEKHRGETSADNLCLSCFDCNRYKGSDVGSVDLETDTFVALFHPRKMHWEDHFSMDDAQITPRTAEGHDTFNGKCFTPPPNPLPKAFSRHDTFNSSA